MTRNFDPKLTPPGPHHTKMGILPTPSYRVSKTNIPPPPIQCGGLVANLCDYFVSIHGHHENRDICDASYTNC